MNHDREPRGRGDGVAAVIGAGPVGRAVVDELVGRGETPLILTRSGSYVPGAHAVPVDVVDTDALTEALVGVDVVYHTAQPPYHRWPEQFPALQASIVEAVSRVGARLVVVENLYGYGPVDGPITESHPLAATTRKGAVRAELWRQLELAHDRGRCRVLAVRASDFIGPGVDASAFGSRFVGALVAGRAAEVYGPLDVLHTVTYVPDLARTMVELAGRDSAFGRAWHAPSAPATTVGDLVGRVASAAGVDATTQRIRPWQLRLAGLVVPAARESVEMQYQFLADFVVDDSAVRAEFGVTHTQLDEIVAATVADRLDVTEAAT